MISSLIIFIISLTGLFLLFWVSHMRQKEKSFERYEKIIDQLDPRVKKMTFRCARKLIVFRETLLRSIQKWGIALVHLSLEIVHFISAKFNKSLAKMKYKARKKVREIKTQEPSEFLRQVKEERE